MLANAPVVRAASARYFFLTTAALTVGILFWNHRMGFADDAELSPIFYLLFVLQDHAGAMCALAILVAAVLVPRSEEHTSELQSQSNLVCRLLLEKKKTQM